MPRAELSTESGTVSTDNHTRSESEAFADDLRTFYSR
jgi:hypothetical protein